jgi:2-oxoisovalerate dehydrogenase E1 component alpha subunit
MAVDNVADRAPGYGFPGVVVDGNDVLACYQAMIAAVDRARAGEGPTLIEAKTYRFFPHTSDDDDRSYRSREEVEEARHHDPIEEFAKVLTERGTLDPASIDAIWVETKASVDEQIEQAWNASDPAPESLLRHVFREGDDPR